MFELNRKPPINKGRLHAIIINLEGDTVDIEFRVGYEEEKKFKSIGTDRLFLQDKEAVKDEKEKIIEKETTDFTDFMDKLNHEGDTIEIALKTLAEKKVIL